MPKAGRTAQQAASSSCVAQQIAEKFLCFVQQWRGLRVFTAARMLFQAGLLALFCLGCSASVWPLPFELDELWPNLFLALQAAVSVRRSADMISRRRPEHLAPYTEVLLHMLRRPPWDAGFLPEPGRKPVSQTDPHRPGGWAHCPLRLMDVCVSGRRLLAWPQRLGSAGGPRLQACHSAVVYQLHDRGEGGDGEGGEASDRTLLILPMSDLSSHITEAFRTWFGGSLALVAEQLGGPSRVDVLVADTDEESPVGEMPRAVRYGGNHGAKGVRRSLGVMGELMGALSDRPLRWLSAPGAGPACYREAVWGFPLPGMAHGRGLEHDCSGSFCFGQPRPGEPPALRFSLDALLPAALSRPRRLQVLLVQRRTSGPRRIVGASASVRAWRRLLGVSADIALWRPELDPIAEQVRRMARADVLAVVTGQACGLGALMRGGSVLLEFTPALDGPYKCRKGWDLNPTSEVGQIARIAGLHHRCVMVSAGRAAAEQTLLEDSIVL